MLLRLSGCLTMYGSITASSDKFGHGVVQQLTLAQSPFDRPLTHPRPIARAVDQSEELEAEMAACRALRALCDDLEKELGSRQQSTGRELAR